VLHLTNQLPLGSCHVMLTINNSYISYYYNHFMVFVRDYTGEPVPEETFTNSHLS